MVCTKDTETMPNNGDVPVVVHAVLFTKRFSSGQDNKLSNLCVWDDEIPQVNWGMGVESNSSAYAS
jgi:hypothetical protein